MSETTTSSTSDRIQCPACHWFWFKDLWDYNFGGDGSEIETECDDCGATVIITRHVAVSYEAAKKR